MVVANASNEAAVRSWFADLLSGSSIVDNNRPHYRIPYKPQIRDLRAVPGPFAKVDLALQGPKSLDVLLSLKLHHAHAQQLKNLKSFHICAINLSGLDVTIARTGYTGAKTGYEIFVHPSQALEFWDLLLEKGKPLGLEPCGLGARDSLRIEAGLPLYSHELDGESNLSPYEAGYPWAVKLDKEFFIGKNYMLERSQTYNTQVFRLGFPGSKGIRPIRTNDAVLDPAGKCIGFVTSSATINEQQVSLALLNKDSVTEAQPVGIYYLARSQAHIDAGKKSIVAKNEILNSDLTGKVLPRFCRF
jgi:glycine cleavage system aminomethyltransferase T